MQFSKEVPLGRGTLPKISITVPSVHPLRPRALLKDALNLVELLKSNALALIGTFLESRYSLIEVVTSPLLGSNTSFGILRYVRMSLKAVSLTLSVDGTLTVLASGSLLASPNLVLLRTKISPFNSYILFISFPL